MSSSQPSNSPGLDTSPRRPSSPSKANRSSATGSSAGSNRSAGIADHDMLAVRRAWRGRGIAQSLKAAQIAWALDNGLIELRTGNEERNTAARAVNAHFPYTPMPDGLEFRGPCAAVE